MSSAMGTSPAATDCCSTSTGANGAICGRTESGGSIGRDTSDCIPEPPPGDKADDDRESQDRHHEDKGCRPGEPMPLIIGANRIVEQAQGQCVHRARDAPLEEV